MKHLPLLTLIPLAISTLGCAGDSKAGDRSTMVAAATETDSNKSTRALLDEPPQSGVMEMPGPPPGLLVQECTSNDQTAQVVQSFRGLAMEMCSCKTVQCGLIVEAKLEQLVKDNDGLHDNDFEDQQNRELLSLAMRMAACQTELLESPAAATSVSN